MERSNEPEKNDYKDKKSKWWIWTLVVVGLVTVLLLVFGNTSILVADEDQPTTMDPGPMNLGDDEDKTLKEEQEYDPENTDDNRE
jgi:flagellar basal body-associated protein FliL